MRILYVEDNEINQALVERVARAKHCEVVFLEEGEEALDLLARDPEITLVLLDIELAGTISGLDVIKTLRARQDQRPVVAVTAYAMMGDRERILNAGCDQYLPKPLVIGDLLALIEHYEHKADAQAHTAPALPLAVEPGANGSAEAAGAAAPTAPQAETALSEPGATEPGAAEPEAPEPGAAEPDAAVTAGESQSEQAHAVKDAPA